MVLDWFGVEVQATRKLPKLQTPTFRTLSAWTRRVGLWLPPALFETLRVLAKATAEGKLL